MSDTFGLLATARPRWVCLLWLAVTIGLGLTTRVTNIEWPVFISEHAGDALWSMAAYSGLAMVLPRLSPLLLFLAALGISYGVEMSQLLDWEWLNTLRATRIGQLFLGTGFQWLDFPRYTCGVLLAVVLDRFYLINRS